MKRYFLFLIAIASLASCRKDEKPYPYQYNLVADYVPTTVGTTWKYGISATYDPSRYLDSMTLTMTGDQRTMDGKTFAVATASSPAFNGFDKFYFYKDNAKYKTYSTILSDFYTGTEFTVPFMMNGSVLNRDTSFYVPNPDGSKPPMWQIETSTDLVPQTVTIGDKTYTNCLDSYVELNKRYDGTDPQYIGTYQVFDIYEFLFAPNVGIVKELNRYEVITLMSSNIKP